MAGSLPGWTRPPRPACSTCWRRPSTPAGRCGGLATTSSSPSGGRTAGWAVGLAGSWRIDRRVGRRYTGCSRTRWPRSSPCSRSGGGRPIASQVGLPRLLLGPGVGVSAATGQLLRELVLDPTKRYQPTGRPPGPPGNELARTLNRGFGPFRCLETSQGGAEGIRTPDPLVAGEPAPHLADPGWISSKRALTWVDRRRQQRSRVNTTPRSRTTSKVLASFVEDKWRTATTRDPDPIAPHAE